MRSQGEDKMLHTKLVVVDGLPGSGKSTTGQWLKLQLDRNGIAARWLHEADVPHPLWWYNHWDGTQYLPPDFDHISMETFIRTSLEKWRNFVTLAGTASEINIVESVFFQNAVAIFLMGDARPTRLMAYAHQVQTIISGLNPVLIYFYQADVALALRRICNLRGQDFENELLMNMERFPYLRRRGLTGLDGVTMLWQEIQKLTDLLFEEYTIAKLALETSGENWSSYQQQILDFLGLPYI
jgi:deoxyadenosine/deoxycytidine kinase